MLLMCQRTVKSSCEVGGLLGLLGASIFCVVNRLQDPLAPVPQMDRCERRTVKDSTHFWYHCGCC